MAQHYDRFGDSLLVSKGLNECERQLADELKAERDQARTCAEEMRDLYAAEIDESIAVFPFPWEDEHGADRDGE